MCTRREVTSAARRVVGGTLIAAALAAGCQAESDERSEAVGQVALELRDVHAGVHCIRIDVTGAGRSLSREFDVQPGEDSSLTLQGLPLGELTFSGAAFEAGCDEVAPTTVGEWASDPVVVQIERGEIAHVMLAMRRNGRGVVDVSFEDEPAVDCGPEPSPRPCGNCGSQDHACDEDSGEWVPGSCENQGPCSPGGMRSCGQLGVQTCTPSCFWDACECGVGTLECDGQCVDWMHDPQHCGGCRVTCGPEQQCDAGQCICLRGLERCGDRCVDLRNDIVNCGQCGGMCMAGQRCTDGRCEGP